MSDQLTQNFVQISEIRDGVVVLKDNTLRAVLMTSAINLGLKSIDEQEAIMSQFRDFLNSLEFDMQISVQSRKLDIRPYLLTLENRVGEQKEELLRVQTREYIEFIKWFTENVNIMDKKFYVVVPYGGSGQVPGSSKKKGLKGLLPSKSKQTDAAQSERFEEKRSQLEQRIAVVQQGLSRLGMRVDRLNTQELIELYYNTYNPGDAHSSVPVFNE